MAKPTVAWDGSDWIQVTNPVRPGASAYELAVQAGFEGTVAQWLATLEGPQGPAGPRGPSGSAGAAGPMGPGIPAGGTTGQILAKASGDDFDFEWITL